MASIDTLTGVTKINAFEYEVTAEVEVGSGIDDVEYATFIQKDTGLLKFVAGCTTTFSECKFIEQPTSADGARDKRFIKNSSTAPVFKGCEFIVIHPLGSRVQTDFDVEIGCYPVFDFSVNGTPCIFVRNNSGDASVANHFFNGTFNSFIVDQDGGGGAFEIMDPATVVNNLTLKDRGLSNPLSSRHLIVYTNRSPFYNQTVTYKEIKADNVACFGGSSTTDRNINIRMVDSKGQLLRSEDSPNSQRGYLQFLRTYESAPLDVTTLTPTTVKCYLKNTDNGEVIIDGLTNGVNEELLQYKYEHNDTTSSEIITYDGNGDPQTTGDFFSIENNYLRGFASYSRLPTSRTFKIEDREDGSSLVDNVVLADDLLITESDKAIVEAYTELETAQKVYDSYKSDFQDNYAGESSLNLSRQGNQIDLGALDLVIDATAVSAFVYADPVITIKSSTYGGGATSTTGKVTTTNGALLSGGTFDCDVDYQSGNNTTITNVVVNGILDINTAGDYILDGCTINEVVNSSLSTVNISLVNGSTITTVGANIELVKNVTISAPNIIDGSRVRIYNNTKDAELDNFIVSGGNGVVSVYNILGSEVNDGDVICMHATYQSGVTAKLPVEAINVISNAGVTFIDSQQDDEIYNTIGLDGSLITEFESDVANNEIDIVVASDFSAHRLYARYVHLLTLEVEIRSFFGAVVAEDIANIRNEVDTVSMYLNNNTSSNLVQTDNVRMYRSDGAYPARKVTTGGGGVDVVWRNQIFVAETNTSGLTEEESTRLFATATQTDVSNLNDPTVQEIANGVWDEPLTGVTHNDPTSAGRRLRQANLLISAESTVNGGTPTTTSFLTNLTHSDDDAYNDQTLVFTSGANIGQAKIISDYDGTSKRVTLDEAFTQIPSGSDEFVILADHTHTITQIQDGLGTRVDLEVINNGVKKASKLIPHNGDLP